MIFPRSAASGTHILREAGKLALNTFSILPHEITDIYGVICGGAFGDPNAWAKFVYGKRPDGKTVRCNVSFFQEDLMEGINFACVYVWSSYKINNSPKDNSVCVSVFQLKDWHASGSMNKENQKDFLNLILRERRIKAYNEKSM